MVEESSKFNLLKMIFDKVGRASKTSNIYLCTSNNKHSLVFLNGDNYLIKELSKTPILGKKWVAYVEINDTLSIINKETKETLYSCKLKHNNTYIRRDNINNNKYTVISFSEPNRYGDTVIIIDNRDCTVKFIFKNVIGINLERLCKVRLTIHTNGNRIKHIKIENGKLVDSERQRKALAC